MRDTAKQWRGNPQKKWILGLMPFFSHLRADESTTSVIARFCGSGIVAKQGEAAASLVIHFHTRIHF
ncbi:hypothetical protein [Helicobacter canis]|uniref:hypothetical protein n=1 Tax=Helicobacter canis TaxID=29419 RepID=UPI000E0EBC51|nr:hypothetical protein [Helicobacter canis]